MRSLSFSKFFAVILIAVVALTGCADENGIREAQQLEQNDPIEPFNRAIFSFNNGLDTVLIKPVAQAYRWITPDPVRNSIRNFLDNLRSPVVFANDLLQAEFTRAGTTLVRFLLNTTIGVAGLIDVAEEMGLEQHKEDFGQTLATWGLGEGFYLVLPVLGPSSARDAVGTVVDIFLDPLTYIANDTENEWMLYSRAIMDGVDTRSRNIEKLDQLKRDSVDYYASLRDVYRQRRAAEIRNGGVDDTYDDKDFLYE